MQDWNYLVGKCMDITVEADDRKWPNADRLEQLFQVGSNSGAFLGAGELPRRLGKTMQLGCGG